MSREDLPADLAALVEADPARIATLYNGLQGMDDPAFEAAFGDSLARLREVVPAESPELAAVVGLALEGGAVADATLLSVHELGGDRVVHTATDDAPVDVAVFVPVRPEDFPPGSGGTVADLDAAAYREVVASMLFLRYRLAEDDSEQLERRYRTPLARGLAAYAGT
jgi:hypothetical protein